MFKCKSLGMNAKRQLYEGVVIPYTAVWWSPMPTKNVVVVQGKTGHSASHLPESKGYMVHSTKVAKATGHMPRTRDES